MKPKVLVITPVKHIKGVCSELESFADVTYYDDPSTEEVLKVISNYDAIYTNPNKSKVFIGKEVIDAGEKLKVICTASTGTNHIDKEYAKTKNLPYVSLTEERHIIERISSTAELAFALTMSALRNVLPSHANALNGEWDYTQYIGRQMNCLTIGVLGYGRLGSMYAKYCAAFGAKVLIFDPYKKITDPSFIQVDSIEQLMSESDIISIHVHVTDETIGMLNKKLLNLMKEDVLVVNSARGDIVNEEDLVDFLKKNPKAKVATDVLADEIRNRMNSPILKYAKESNQVTITQHIGGMTREAQEIAFGHAAHLLKSFFTKRNF